MNNKRPINLDLTTLSFPVTAIVSILHRISGMVIFLLLPGVLYLLGKSLQSESGYLQMEGMLGQPFYQLMLWAFCSALLFHVLAGIRHLIMDMGLGESLIAGKRTAKIVIGLGIISTFFLGIWLW